MTWLAERSSRHVTRIKGVSFRSFLKVGVMDLLMKDVKEKLKKNDFHEQKLTEKCKSAVSFVVIVDKEGKRVLQNTNFISQLHLLLC